MVMDAGRERWSDRELLSAIADCDGEAFTVFYRRHLPATVAFLLRETHDREATADLTAEVFSAIMLAARRYRPERDTAAPWVLGIARNTLGASRRRRRVEDRARQRLGFEPVELDDSDLERTDQSGWASQRAGPASWSSPFRITSAARSRPASSMSAATARSPQSSSARKWSSASGSAAVLPGFAKG